MTPGSGYVIILITWSKLFISKMLSSTKSCALTSPSFLFLKSTVNKISL